MIDRPRSWCKDCVREYNREKKREYRNNNLQESRRKNNEWRLKNKDKVREYKKKEYEKNRDKILEKKREYYKENKEKILEERRNYKQRSYKRRAERYKKDKGYMIEMRLRARFYGLISVDKKKDRFYDLVGCTKKELKEHIESTFKRGMCWDNYSEWHIDHIRPCSSFDLTDSEQQKECFNYRNLQALWAEENLIKSSKHEDVQQ